MMVLHKAQEIADRSNCTALRATSRMMWTGFFFLGRPGEYTASRSECKFFKMKHVTLLKDGKALDLARAPDATLHCCSDVLLDFDKQKHGHRGERVGQKASGHRYASPTIAIADQICHLRANNASPDTPLCAFAEGGSWFVVTSEMVTDLLRQAVRACPECGLSPEDISARSLRATGAMAMLCDGIDSNKIKLLGRWKSDEMLKYLHIQAEPLYRDLSARMLRGGNYTFAPGSMAHAYFQDQQPETLYHQ